MSTERFLVTGAAGCIGAWAVRLLLDEGVPVVATDLSAGVRETIAGFQAALAAGLVSPALS